jgi:hypothetical protein
MVHRSFNNAIPPKGFSNLLFQSERGDVPYNDNVTLAGCDLGDSMAHDTSAQHGDLHNYFMFQYLSLV